MLLRFVKVSDTIKRKTGQDGKEDQGKKKAKEVSSF